MLMGTCKRCTTTISSTSAGNPTSKRQPNQLVPDAVMVNAQQRNDIEECPLTQSNIPLIVKQVVDSLSETGGRPSRTINSRNQAPEATGHSSSIMVEPLRDVRNINSAAGLSGTTISMNDREIVTANNEVDASTSRDRMLDSTNKPSSTRTLCN